MKTRTPLLLPLLLFLGCAGSYFEPAQKGLGMEATTRTYDASPEAVYEALGMSPFFDLEQIEPAHGYAAGTFLADFPARYVDAGRIRPYADKESFDYTTRMAERHNLKLWGRIELFITALEEERTQVKVLVHYQARVGETMSLSAFSEEIATDIPVTWTFTSHSSDTRRVGTISLNGKREGFDITFAPSGRLEARILDQAQDWLERD